MDRRTVEHSGASLLRCVAPGLVGTQQLQRTNVRLNGENLRCVSVSIGAARTARHSSAIPLDPMPPPGNGVANAKQAYKFTHGHCTCVWYGWPPLPSSPQQHSVAQAVSASMSVNTCSCVLLTCNCMQQAPSTHRIRVSTVCRRTPMRHTVCRSTHAPHRRAGHAHATPHPGPASNIPRALHAYQETVCLRYLHA